MAVGAWTWGGLTFGQYREGVFLVIGGRSRRSSRRYRLDGTTLLQVGGWEPLVVEFDAYDDDATRSALETAATGGPHTLAGPDSESYSNMQLLGIGSPRMVINAPGVRIRRLRFEEDG